MIMIEGSAFIGFVFMITLPIYSIYSLFKYMKRKFEDHKIDLLIHECDVAIAETQEYMREVELKFAEINRLQEAIDNCSDKEERQILLNRLYALLDSN